MAARYSSYGRATKRVKVAHRMTPYDYAVRSIIFQDSNLGERQNILEGEALMESIPNVSTYLATQRHVHSDQVALLGNNVATDAELARALRDLRFAGFAVTGFDQKYGVYEQGFMATIGGVNTVMNTGSKYLEAGLPVLVIPTKDTGNDAHKRAGIKGVHRDKHLFALVHPTYVDGGTDPYSRAVAALINEPGVRGRLAAEDYLKKFMVGTCIRGGRAGQPVDVVLHASSGVIEQSILIQANPAEVERARAQIGRLQEGGLAVRLARREDGNAVPLEVEVAR